MLVAVVALVVVAGAVAGTVRALAGNPDPPAVPPADAGRPGDVLLVPGYGGSTTALDTMAARISAAGGHAIVVQLAGDGTGDHLLAAGVAHVAPAWRPGERYGPFEVAYVAARGRVVVRDGDTGRVLWSTVPGPRPFVLVWSADGRRLLVLSPRQARTYSGSGALISRIALPAGASDGALSPDGRRLALVLGDREVIVGREGSLRQVLAGPGVKAVSWSPDGRWLLVTWPAANQWVFVRVAGAPRIEAVSRISQQFSSGGAARAFPELDGWCCTARGSAG